MHTFFYFRCNMKNNLLRKSFRSLWDPYFGVQILHDDLILRSMVNIDTTLL